MKRSRFTEQQIIAVLRQAESGTAVEDLCRRAGISTVKFYKGEGEVRGHANQRNASPALAGRGKWAAEKDCGAAIQMSRLNSPWRWSECRRTRWNDSALSVSDKSTARLSDHSRVCRDPARIMRIGRKGGPA